MVTDHSAEGVGVLRAEADFLAEVAVTAAESGGILAPPV